MPKDATINARVDSRLKKKADAVLARVGVRTSDLITMLLHQVVLHDGVPFDVKIPNAETSKAMAELDAGKGETFRGSGKELIEHVLGARKSRKA